jgi:hypothetical protein
MGIGISGHPEAARLPDHVRCPSSANAARISGVPVRFGCRRGRVQDPGRLQKVIQVEVAGLRMLLDQHDSSPQP